MKYFIILNLLVNISTFPTLEFQWYKSIYKTDSFQSKHTASPLIEDSHIYITDNTGRLYALNLNTGKRVWKSEVGGEVLVQPAINNNRIYLSTTAGKLVCIDSGTGRVLWDYLIINTSLISRPAFLKTSAIVATYSGEIYAFDESDGKLLWQYKRKNSNPLMIHAVADPVIHNSIVYAGFPDGYIIGINPSNGKEIWSLKLPLADKFEGIYAAAVAEKDVLFIPKYEGGLYAVSIPDKKIIWQRNDDGYLWCNKYNEYLYAATLSGKLIKINPNSGSSPWFLDLKKFQSFPIPRLLSVSEPAEHKSLLFVSAENGIYAIDSDTGKTVWQFKPSGTFFPAGISSAPQIHGDSVIFISDTGTLYKFKYN